MFFRLGLLLGVLLILLPRAALATVATPVFAPIGNISATVVNIAVTCSSSNATIYYTVDGSDPTQSSPTIVSGSSVMVGRNLTLKAKAWSGTDSSAIQCVTYTIPGAIAAGEYHMLALNYDAESLWAWGRDTEGELGNGALANSYSPVAVSVPSGVPSIVGIATGIEHSAALTGSGNVLCWGYNAYGQLGNGTTANQDLPVYALSGTGVNLAGVSEIAGGGYHTVALKLTGSGGTVWSWGYNPYGELGDGTTTTRTMAVQAKTSGSTYVTNAVAIAAGYWHTLALTSSNTVLSWGYNTYGQLGDGTASGHRSYAYAIPNLTNVVSVACGSEHSFALKGDGTVWGWGYNAYGQLGNGNATTPQTSPVEMMMSGTTPMTNVIAVAGGEYHTLILRADGTVWSCGYNMNGALGDGTSGNYLQNDYPIQVQTSGSTYLANIVAVAAGNSFSAALGADGTIYTWGYGGYGALGDGAQYQHPYFANATNYSTLPIVGNRPPTVTLSMSAGPYVNPADITLTADPEDYDGNDTISRVDFFNGSTLLGSVSQSPYTFLWQSVSSGTYSFTAVATDMVGATGTSAVVTASVAGNPDITDSDGDGYPDSYEIAAGTNPNDATSTPAPTFVVDAAGTGDFTTIQEAIDSSTNDYTIIEVLPGTYQQPISIYGYKMLIYSAGGAANTIIDGAGAAPALYVNNTSVIRGFTITDGAAEPGGISGGIFVDQADPEFQNCVVMGNSADTGGALYNNYGAPTFVNCTFVGNTSSDSAIYNVGYYSTFENSILWDIGCTQEIDGNPVIAQYCDVLSGTTGAGNISADPLISAGGHLTDGSPCINAGSSALVASGPEMDGENRTDGSPDIGVDEYVDTDGDGMPDWWETENGLNPLDSSDANVVDDSGLTNLQEYQSAMQLSNESTPGN